MARASEQAKRLKAARATLDTTSAELADLLGVKLATLQNWLLPAHSQRHREMPKTARLLLDRILSEHRGSSKA